MSIRLSSFLSSVERGFQAGNPVLKGGNLETTRTINYHLGLARLTLATKASKSAAESLGSILVQAYDLADGSTCLKVNLSWTKHEDAGECAHSIFEKPAVDWSSEAAQIATAWLAGPPALPEVEKMPQATDVPEQADALAAAG
jgi:hypothetical protein